MIGTENLKITHPSSPESRSTEDFFPSFNMVAPSVLPLPPKNLIRLLLCSFCAAARRDAANSDNTLFVHASYTAEIVNNSTSARKYCAQPAALMSKGQYFVGTKHPLCRSTGGSLSKNLIEFAPAGAKKVRSFSSATCAAKKILLGLQTCAPSAGGGQRVRCSQAANPFVKKYYFLTGTPGHVSCPGMALAFYFAWMLINSVRSLE